MTSVADHYAAHLAPHYIWMCGGIEAALDQGAAELETLGLPRSPGDLVLDLGAGFGLHSISLARRGARVVAVDSSAHLLQELQALAVGLPVRTVRDDLLSFRNHLDEAPRAILCMGDTLTHLQQPWQVEQLVASAFAALPSGGRLVLSLRDHTTERSGDERFIPVRADTDRILTCFLEYEPQHVVVHDLLHLRTDGRWRTAVSHYRKLRIAPAALMRGLSAAGFEARCDASPTGLVRLVAIRP